MYRLFISSLPVSCSLSALRAFFSTILNSKFRLEKNKSKGRNTIYHAILSVEDQQEYQLLLRKTCKLGGLPLEISPYVTRESRLSQDELVKGRKVHVSSIPSQCDASLLERAFESFGAVEDVYIRKDKSDIALYAFVTFADKAVASKLIAQRFVPIEGHSPCQISIYTKKVQSTTSLGTPPTSGRQTPHGQPRCLRRPYPVPAERRGHFIGAIQPFARPTVSPYLNYPPMGQVHRYQPQLIRGGFRSRFPEPHYVGRRACFLHPDFSFPSISELENAPQVNFGASQHSIRRVVRDLTHLPENLRLNFQ